MERYEKRQNNMKKKNLLKEVKMCFEAEQCPCLVEGKLSCMT
jgi:hypothetical protein